MRKVIIVAVAMFLLIASCSAGTTAAKVQTLLQTFTPTANSVGCIDFSTKVGPYVTGSGLTAPTSFIDQLLTIIQTQTPYRCIMIYDVYADVISIAQSKGFKVLAIVWLSLDTTANAAANTRAISAASAYPDTIVGFSCGSELAFRNGITSAVNSVTLNCIDTLRTAGVTHPIGVIDSLKTWNANWTISSEADFLGVNNYVWYDNTNSPPTCTSASVAAQQTLNRFKNVQAKYSKSFIMTEFGWPGADAGTTVSYNCGISGDVNQKQVVSQVIELFRQNKLPLSTFQAFRDSSKGTATTLFKNYWGICLGTSPYTCVSPPTLSATTTTTTIAPSPVPAVTTCPPLPDSCPCGVVLPAGSICKRCKLSCPSTTSAPTTTTTAKPTTTTTHAPVTTTTVKPTTTTTHAPVTTTAKPTTTTTKAVTTTVKPTTTTTTIMPTPVPSALTTCPPLPDTCPCGIVLPAGSVCKRCKINCPTTTSAPTTTTTKAPTTTTIAKPTTTTTHAPVTTTKAPTTTTTHTPVTTTTVAPTSGSCPTNWIKYENSCYFVDSGTYANGVATCASLGAQLLVISSAGENSFALDSLSPGNAQSAFLGLTKSTAGAYLTAALKTPSYVNWKSGEPSTGLDCVTMIRDSASSSVGKWKTESCTAIRLFVCKKSL